MADEEEKAPEVEDIEVVVHLWIKPGNPEAPYGDLKSIEDGIIGVCQQAGEVTVDMIEVTPPSGA